MALCLFGTLLALIELVKFEEIKKFVLYGIVIAGVAMIVLSQTSFKDQFMERFEARGLNNARSLDEENRMIEFGLLYRDLFVYYDYDPWFGFGLLNSSGNYGKQIFGKRSLHTDPTNLVHSSGFLGLGLYVMMFSTLFMAVWQRTKNREDFIRFHFCLFRHLLY
jgi:O-antigen ligase